MIKALLLIFEPQQAWDSVARAQRKFGFIFLTYLLPMVIITATAEGYGLVRWGRLQSEIDRVRKFQRGEAIVYEVLQSLLTIAVVLIAAKILKSLGETFHGRHTFTQAFTTVVYGLSPLFLFRLLDMFNSSLTPWPSWAIGVVLSVAVFYQGVPRVMQPDPPHAFGLYLMNSVLIIIITGLARFVTAWYLEGRFRPVEQFISEIAGRLPF